MHRYWRH